MQQAVLTTLLRLKTDLFLHLLFTLNLIIIPLTLSFPSEQQKGLQVPRLSVFPRQMKELLVWE